MKTSCALAESRLSWGSWWSSGHCLTKRCAKLHSHLVRTSNSINESSNHRRCNCGLLWSTNMCTICFVAFASFALIEHTKLTTVIVRVTELEVTTAWDTSINYRMCFFSPVYGSKVCPWSRWALSKLWLFFPIWWEQLFEQMQRFIAQKSQLASDGLHLEFIDYKVLGFWRVSCSFLFSSFLRMCCTLEG